MLRVFHVPSHLTYAATLSDTAFAPGPLPPGQPLRVADLLALNAWDFFDVLHLHTVELATYGGLDQLVARTKRVRTGIVFTTHDLAPNIETDGAAFESKTALLAWCAQAVGTLTTTAVEVLADRAGIVASAVHKLSHGAALPLVGNTAASSGIAAFGAMRPNRDFGALLVAWRWLSPRPPLRVLVRSLGERDRRRYASLLAELDQAAQAAVS